MSELSVGCFGKLPFMMLDELQLRAGAMERYWADAVLVSPQSPLLVSIDTLNLDAADLPGSVSLAIVHSMNDIFAANGLPTSFTVSMTLPKATGSDALLSLVESMKTTANWTRCQLGKIHTSRSDTPPLATVAVNGAPVLHVEEQKHSGKVILVGSPSGSLIVSQQRKEIEIRMRVVNTIGGKKKDVSGDGLAGGLVQLSRREHVAIIVSAQKLEHEHLELPIELDISKNYLDYAGLIQGDCSQSLRRVLFAPRTFGPIICLVDQNQQLDESFCKTIGIFEANRESVRLVE